jgi:hypothetical protein
MANWLMSAVRSIGSRQRWPILRAPPARDLPTFPGDPLAATVIESLPPSIRDHLMDRYLRALGGL